eukprot:15274094-Ditylum_brightwellii.AAC.1
MESPSDQESIPDLVHCFCLDMLDCYAALPAKNQTMEDLLLALRQFKNFVCWKEYWRLQRAIKNKATNKEDDVSTSSSLSDESK